MQKPLLGLALACLTYTATETTTWAGCGSRIDGNDDPDCKVASNLGTAATTKDIARPVAQWSVGGRPKCVTVAQCAQVTALHNAANAIEDAKKTVENAVIDAAGKIVDPNARQMELEGQIIMDTGCNIGSLSMSVVSVVAGPIALVVPPLAAMGVGVLGTVVGAQSVAFGASENAGLCE